EHPGAGVGLEDPAGRTATRLRLRHPAGVARDARPARATIVGWPAEDGCARPGACGRDPPAAARRALRRRGSGAGATPVRSSRELAGLGTDHPDLAVRDRAFGCGDRSGGRDRTRRECLTRFLPATPDTYRTTKQRLARQPDGPAGRSTGQADPCRPRASSRTMAIA